MVEIEELNPRRFNLWGTVYHRNAMLQAAELKFSIEKEAIETNDGMLHGLEPRTLDPELLYLIVDSYLSSYEALTKEKLIKTGNHPKVHPQIH
jgi:hypothetical protein